MTTTKPTTAIDQGTAMKSSTHFKSTLLAGGITAAIALPAAAQTADVLLEEIIVTAQKRQQQAIDVPISMGTFSQGTL